MSTFADLASINVGAHIEKKNGFSYLSWAYAVAELRKAVPDATWEVVRFDGLPFLKTECGYFVEVAVTVDGIRLSQLHPVLDNRNRPIAQPDSFHINTSIQRALVKAIALHGLGLYVYAGEDLPESDAKGPETVETPALGIMMDCLAKLDGWPLLKLQAEDESAFRSAFGRLNTKQKALHRELEQAAAQARLEYRNMLHEAFSNEDTTSATQLIDELTTPERKQLVWAVLEQPVKAWLKKIKEEM